MDKYLLRRSQTGILPNEIRLRPKTPVTVDAMLLQVASGKGNPTAGEPIEERMLTIVDWKLLTSYLQQTIDDSLYVHLRPISLARWLKNH